MSDADKPGKSPATNLRPRGRCARGSNPTRSTARSCRPIYLSTNFAFERYLKPRKYDYTRSGNPTRDQLAAALADLEGGAGAVVTCTGLAAITLILATLPHRARVLAPYDCYGGTYRLLAALHAQDKLVVDFVDQSDAAALSAALAAKPELVWIETPSNPLLRIVDIRAVAQAAHAVGALVAADNTFLSPLWQQPLALGADLVMHSTTKYLNGHSDVVGGAVIAATARARGEYRVVGKRHRRHGRAVRQLLELARRAHPARAHARACRECRGGRRRIEAPSGGAAGVLSGAPDSSRP